MSIEQGKIESIQHVLFCLLRLVSLLGLIILTFGFPYSYILLDLYGGTMLSEGNGPTLLRSYCVYVLLIAINGTTECFVFAAMNQHQVDGYNKKMLGFSALFLFASYFLTLLFGSVGFIFANCINMAVRVMHSIYFIHRYFGDIAKSPLSGVIPHSSVLATLMASFVVCNISERILCGNNGMLYRLLHIIVGGICLLMVGIAILLKEQRVITFLNNQYVKKKRS